MKNETLSRDFEARLIEGKLRFTFGGIFFTDTKYLLVTVRIHLTTNRYKRGHTNHPK